MRTIMRERLLFRTFTKTGRGNLEGNRASVRRMGENILFNSRAISSDAAIDTWRTGSSLREILNLRIRVNRLRMFSTRF